jgi:hypothetical protein
MEGICLQHSEDQHRSIERTAYELYVQKGRRDGDDLSDWFQAEKMVFEKSSPEAGDDAPKRKTASPKSKTNRGKKPK